MSVSARIAIRACAAASLLALVAGCGGGGGGDDTSGDAGKVVVTDTSPSPSPSASATATPSPSTTPTTTPTTSPSPSGYQLVWQDEFNGAAISTRCWGYWWNPTNTPNEMQAFGSNPKNTVVKDGMLNLVAYKENVTVNGKTYPYSSSQVYTGGKGSWKYGRFEARIKIPKGAGLWPVFWLLPEDEVYGGWPNSGEVDIAEWIGIRPKEVYNSVHAPGAGGGDDPTTKVYASAADMGDDFHTYALEWTATSMKYFFDGQQENEITRWGAPSGKAFPAPFDQTFYVVLTMGVGGDWPGAPTAQTVFPSTMLVDWVRVYQQVTTTGAPFSCS